MVNANPGQGLGRSVRLRGASYFLRDRWVTQNRVVCSGNHLVLPFFGIGIILLALLPVRT